MTMDETLMNELAEESARREVEFVAGERAARDEELSKLERIGFRAVLYDELVDYVIPYLQRNSKNARFVLDPMDDTKKVIGGYLAKKRSRLTFMFNPSFNGHNQVVYNAIDFYPNGNIGHVPESIIQGMRETRDNIVNYFRKAEIIGGKPKESKSHSKIITSPIYQLSRIS